MSVERQGAGAMGEVRLAVVGRIATITIDQVQRRNAMTLTMWRQLREAVDRVADDPSVRVLVLRGAGDHFCAGMDVTGGTAEAHPMGRLSVTSRAILNLHHLRVPTIARLDGSAVGAGANLALGCDLVVASDRASLSQIFVHRGLSVDCGGSWLLPRLVGLHKARELCFLGEMVEAADGLAMGLYTRVVEARALDEEVQSLAERLAALPPVALQQSKRLINEGSTSSFELAMESEMRAQSVNLQGADSLEAFTAFLEKRPGTYSGGGYRCPPTSTT
jgi:enoyl-CoA hydratase/carnithine racemase